MIRRILIVLLIFMLVSLLLLWVLTGGIGRVNNASTLFTNPIETIFGGVSLSDTLIKLPWQPADITQGPDLSEYTDPSSATDPQSSLDDLQSQYDDLKANVQEAQTFGNPSPERGKIVLAGGENARNEDANAEYVELRARSSNTSPITLTGWSLQSAITGIRVYLPSAASPFIGGAVNTTAPVYLDPGATALVHTSPSPVGVSLRENLCTGYLQQFQSFTPQLDQSCPSPSDSLTLTPENVLTYGDACIDFVRTLSSCTFPTTVPTDLSPECRSFVSNEFSYNGCLSRYRYRTDFMQNTWHLYLSSQKQLWRDTHDIIRLLDKEGRTVDAITY